MKPVEIFVPLPVIRGKKGTYVPLSANLYRNSYFHTLNNSKVEYGKTVEDIVKDLEEIRVPVKIDFKFFFTNKRRRDIDNFLFPISKYLCDILVRKGIMEEDNMLYYPEISASYGGIATTTNYAQVTITESTVDVSSLQVNKVETK